MWAAIATWPFAIKPIELASKMLPSGASALDCVESGIKLIEADPEVDSVGLGGFPNLDCEIELDAAIMDGNKMLLGSVSALKGYLHAISVARQVMEKTIHTMITGAGAARFAQSVGAQKAELVTEAARKLWQERKAQSEKPHGHDTVGMVALNPEGLIAVGVSTSGMGMKLPGRVGDSPLIGSGFYADASAGGAAATGLGEDIMKGVASFTAVEMMRSGLNPREAAERTVARVHNMIARQGRNPGNIALVCLNMAGEFGGAANHNQFHFAAANADKAATVYEVAPVALRESSDTKLELINNIANPA